MKRNSFKKIIAMICVCITVVISFNAANCEAAKKSFSFAGRAFNANNVSVLGKWKNDMLTLGKTKGKNLQTINLKFNNGTKYAGKLQYKVYSKNKGWSKIKNSGKTAGTKGFDIQRIKVRLTGEIATRYDIYYRVNVTGFGWLGWTFNYATAGIKNASNCIKCIQIKMVKKNKFVDDSNVPNRAFYDLKKKNNPTKRIAHRGQSFYAPDNTAISFVLAAEAGYWGIETDVRQLADGTLICSHDANADTDTTGGGAYNRLDFSYVNTLLIDHGNGLDKYPNQHVCTFEEYLDICKRYNCYAIIDMKYSSIATVDSIVAMVKKKGMMKLCIFQCSLNSYLEEVRRIAPNSTRWYLANYINADSVKAAKSLGCTCINANYISKEGICLAHINGLKSCCWMSSSNETRALYKTYGIDYIMSSGDIE